MEPSRRAARSFAPLLFVLLLVACAAPAASPAKPAAPATGAATASAPATSAPGVAKPADPAPVASKESVGPLSPPVTVRMAKLPLVSDAGMHLAVERGYFRDEGINIESIPFDSAGQMVAPLGTGQLDVGGGALGAGLFNAIAREVPLKIVGDKGSLPVGLGWQALIVRSDLADQIRDYGDLRGRKIAINQLRTNNELALDQALRRGGLTLQDVETIQMSYPDQNTALSTRNIDVAQSNEPFMATALEQGLAVRFRGMDEYYPNMQFSVILYGPQFVRDQPEAARRWMVGYVRGIREYNDAIRKGINKDEVVQLLMRQVTIRDPALFDKMVPTGLDPDGRMNVQGLRDDLRWYVEQGMVQQPPDLDRVIDTSYTDYAVSRLGPYPR